MTDDIEPPFQIGGTGTLTPRQRQVLLRRLNPNRVRQLRGLSHMEAWDIRRALIRIFGFGGWDDEIRSLDHVETVVIPPIDPTLHPLHDSGKGRPRYVVVYRCLLRLIIKDVTGRPICFYDDAAAGDAVNMFGLGDAHDFAMKTAISQALKRCAVNMGDQFGLSLYNNGSTDPVVQMVITDQPEDQPEDLPEDPQVQPEESLPQSTDPGPYTGPEPEDVPQTPQEITPAERLKRGRAALKNLGDRAGWTTEELAADFHDWTEGKYRIGVLPPDMKSVRLLLDYYQYKEQQAMAAHARAQDGAA